MKLTKYSENRLLGSLDHWNVPRDFATPMYDYLVHGFAPGGFFTGWYAGDAMSIIHSHPVNAVQSLKDLSKWMINCMPPAAKGSYEKVIAWTKMPEAERRKILEAWDLVYTEEEETWKTLKGDDTRRPSFWA